MVHQHRSRPGQQLSSAELACARPGHLAPEQLGEELGPVTDAEHGKACREQLGVDRGANGSLTDFGPPERMTPRGLRAIISAALIEAGTISE